MTKVSAQKAIHNYCKGCIYNPLAGGTWRDQVENCTVTRCELYEHRPRSTAYKKEQRLAYLASLSPEQAEQERLKSQAMAERLRK